MSIKNRKSFELPPTAGLPVDFSDYFKTPHQSLGNALQNGLSLPLEPIFTCSGTAAFIVILKTLQKLHKNKTDVILPAYTCPLVPLAVQQVGGLRAVVCDTAPQSFELSAGELAKLCTAKTLAIIPTHLGGQVANVEPICHIAKQHGAFVIEDAAQAIGAFSKGQSVGLAGDAAFFSMAVGKGLTTFEGGFLIAKDKVLHEQLKSTANELLKSNIFWTIKRNLELLGYALMYQPSRLWYVYGKKLAQDLAAGNEVEAVGDYFTPKDIPLHSLDAMRLRVAANAFNRLPRYLNEGIRRAQTYLEVFKAHGIDIITSEPNSTLTSTPNSTLTSTPRGAQTGTPQNSPVWPFFIVLMPTQEQRDAALKSLWTSGLGVSKLFIHTLGDYSYLAGSTTQNTPCLNAKDFSSRILTITNTHWLTSEIFRHIIKTISSVL